MKAFFQGKLFKNLSLKTQLNHLAVLLVLTRFSFMK
jgi:hypothetical protein